MEYDRSKDPMLAMDYWKPDAPKYSDLHKEIESLRQQLAHAETNVAAQAEMLEKVIRERDEYLRDLGAMKNWIADWHKKDTELATVTKERDELVFALRYIEAQTHLGHIHDTANAALAKVGADKTGEKG